ncbi:Ribonuclease II [Desulfovibrionales bacterium]
MNIITGSVYRPAPGCLAELILHDRPLIAWVMAEAGGQLRLVTVTKRELKLSVSRLLPWLGPQRTAGASRQAVQDELEVRQAERERLAARIDPLEIWKLALGELSKARPEWFAELLWERPDLDHVAAIGRTLLACKTHFRFRPPDFEVFPAELVEARLAAQQAAEECERLATVGRSFFLKLWAVAQDRQAEPPTPPTDPGLSKQLETLLKHRLTKPEDAESKTVWDLVQKGLPEHPHQALLLAQAWGLIPAHYNQYLEQAGYTAGDAWAMTFTAEIAAQRKAFDLIRRTPEILDLISIDSPTTRDIDDAFAVTRRENGKFDIRIALACPALAWEINSPMDQVVAERSTSLYLPEGTSHMLPEALGTDLFSLWTGKDRPVLLLEISVNTFGDITAYAVPRLTWVRVAANLSYEMVEANYTGDKASAAKPFTASLEAGLILAEALRARRIRHGATVIERNEPEIVLKGLDINDGQNLTVLLGPRPDTPRAQLLVSELMILANEATAAWASCVSIRDGHDVRMPLPLIHRTQVASLKAEQAGILNTPLDVYRAVKAMGNSQLEVTTRPHSGLGVPLYALISSPLRRYTDLLNLIQILHYLAHGSPRWDHEALKARLTALNTRLESVSRIQRFRTRYWKLLYCKQQADKRRFLGVLIEKNQYFVTIALPAEQLFVRGPHQLFGDKCVPGTAYTLNLGRINPMGNEIHIIDAEAVETI